MLRAMGDPGLKILDHVIYSRYSHPVSHFCDIRQHWSEKTSQLNSILFDNKSIITEIRSLKNFDLLLHRTQS